MVQLQKMLNIQKIMEIPLKNSAKLSYKKYCSYTQKVVVLGILKNKLS